MAFEIYNLTQQVHTLTCVRLRSLVPVFATSRLISSTSACPLSVELPRQPMLHEKQQFLH